MTANNQKHVTATKFGPVLELKFVFNSATKDGYAVESAFEANLMLRNKNIKDVDDTVLLDMEAYLETDFARHMQTFTDIFTSKMTAEEIKTYNKDGELPNGVEEALIADTKDLTGDVYGSVDNFSKKFGSLFREGEIEVTYKPRLKGPTPQ